MNTQTQTPTKNTRAATLLSISTHLSAKGLSMPQYCLLGILTPEGVSMTTVAKALRCTSAAVTGLVDRMERGGFIRRTPAKSDRRVLLLTTTAKGQQVLNLTEAGAPAVAAAIHPASN